MEIAVPLEKANEALDVVRDCIQEFSRKAEAPFWLNLPVNIRFLKGEDKNLIGNKQSCNVCYIDVATYPAFKNWQPFFRSCGSVGKQQRTGRMVCGVPPPQGQGGEAMAGCKEREGPPTDWRWRVFSGLTQCANEIAP